METPRKYPTRKIIEWVGNWNAYMASSLTAALSCGHSKKLFNITGKRPKTTLCLQCPQEEETKPKTK